MFNADAYQQEVLRTAGEHESVEERLKACAFGLGGEAGEVLDHLKKAFYHGHALDLGHLREELGDVLWYVANMADALGTPLSDIMDRNVRKLQARYPDGFSTERSVNRAA